MTTLLQLEGVCVSYGDVRALHDVTLSVSPGTVVGLIGPNGAGKTTLLDVVSGFVRNTSGSVLLDGAPLDQVSPHRRARLGLGRTFQSVDLFDDMSIADNLAVAAEAAPGGRVDVRRAADIVGIDATDRRLAGAVSLGERKRVAIARALTAQPRVLLLDEPAAGLDHHDRARLGELLRDIARAGPAVVLVDHDLSLVMDSCDRVVVLDLGRVLADGEPSVVRADPAVVAAYVGQPLSAPSTPPADAASTQPLALATRGLCAGYGGASVVTDVDLDVARGEIVALLGPNGAGKTTTLLTISGVLPRIRGEVEVLGRPLRPRSQRRATPGVAHVVQGRSVFSELTVAENLRLVDRDGSATREVLALLPALGPLLRKTAGRLSGGEQQMLALARALAARPELLIIDELSLGLAPKVVGELLDTLSRLASEAGTAVLLAEQHAGLALSVASRAYLLAGGRVVDSGPAAAFAADPRRLSTGYLGRN